MIRGGSDAARPPQKRLGLEENLGPFALLLVINAFVGAMVGMERSVLPVLAEEEFGIASRTGILSFLISFGLVKAITNGFAGLLADRWGRRRVLLAGWVAALPVPLMIIWAPSWEWVVAANVLLGINQGLCWSVAIIMKVDLVGGRQRGLAIGLNESTGYIAVSIAALASGYLAAHYGLRPAPFLIGVGAALGGLLLSLKVEDTREHARIEAESMVGDEESGLRPHDIPKHVSWKSPSLRAVSQAGLVNNLNDGMSWGLFPLFFVANGATLATTAFLVALYPLVWGVAQLGTGALSDVFGRKWVMVIGMWIQALALIGVAFGNAVSMWTLAIVALGLGTALAYPTFLSAVSDHSYPSWRASALGIYRWWRDLGYAIGAVLTGLIADAFDMPSAIVVVGVLTALSGMVVAASYREKPPKRTRSRRA